jgi:hypothetical protein
MTQEDTRRQKKPKEAGCQFGRGDLRNELRRSVAVLSGDVGALLPPEGQRCTDVGTPRRAVAARYRSREIKTMENAA